MSRRASAPPVSARAEIVVGGGLAFVGALILLVHLGSIPGFVAELVIGFVDVPAFWPMLGGALLLAGGLYSIRRGRRGLRNHHRVVARIEAMREREQQRRPRGATGAGGVSAGVAGTAHRTAARF